MNKAIVLSYIFMGIGIMAEAVMIEVHGHGAGLAGLGIGTHLGILYAMHKRGA